MERCYDDKELDSQVSFSSHVWCRAIITIEVLEQSEQRLRLVLVCHFTYGTVLSSVFVRALTNRLNFQSTRSKAVIKYTILQDTSQFLEFLLDDSRNTISILRNLRHVVVKINMSRQYSTGFHPIVGFYCY